jgi:hypothetical protein
MAADSIATDNIAWQLAQLPHKLFHGSKLIATQNISW